jgi:hypothetical protein
VHAIYQPVKVLSTTVESGISRSSHEQRSVTNTKSGFSTMKRALRRFGSGVDECYTLGRLFIPNPAFAERTQRSRVGYFVVLRLGTLTVPSTFNLS